MQLERMKFEMPCPQEMNSLIEFCKVMAQSPFYQKLGPGGVLAIYMTAKEYNLPFMACMNGGLHTFDGKVTFSAIMVNALILNAGHKADLIYLDNQKCIIHFKRGDRHEKDYEGLEVTYTMEDARIAGYLTKDNWRKSPKNMLYSRCLTNGARIVTPEVMVGVIVAGEYVDIQVNDSNVQPQVPAHSALIDDQTFRSTNSNEISSKMASNELPKIDFCETDDYKIFCEKLGIGTGNLTEQYFEDLVLNGTKNKSKDHFIECAFKNEEGFNKMFEKWKAAKNEKTETLNNS